ncbi:MAG: vWA domain-containing protein [Rhizobiaceae bacterium]
MLKFLENTSGSIIPTLALLAVPLMLAAGAALDLTRVYNERSHLQAAVDAAAIAAGTEISKLSDAQLEILVSEHLIANLGQTKYNYINSLDFTINRDAAYLRVDAHADIPTSFLRVAGKDIMEYATSASITGPRGLVEIVLVLDNTGSMSQKANANGSQTKMEALKIAASDFILDQLENNLYDERVKIGIVPFARYVNVGSNNEGADWIDNGSYSTNWMGCVGSRPYPLDVDDSSFNNTKVPTINGNICPDALTPLTTDENTLLSSINAMSPSGYTYITAGLSWGLRTLSSSQPFTEGTPYEDMEDDNVKKVVIVMTDGDNTVAPKTNSSKTHTNFDGAKEIADAKLSEMCNETKSKDILVFTIGFGKKGAIAPDTLDLLENCSTDGENFANANDAAALQKTFDQIGAKLGELYLSS